LGRGDFCFLRKKLFVFCLFYFYSVVSECVGSYGVSVLIALFYILMCQCVVAFSANSAQVA